MVRILVLLMAALPLAAAISATLQTEVLPNGRARVLVNAKDVDSSGVYRVFGIRFDPAQAVPIGDRETQCSRKSGDALTCSFELDLASVKLPYPVTLMLRKSEAPEEKTSYRPILFGMIKADQTGPMSPSLEGTVYTEPHARKHVNGALLVDDFDAPALDTKLWRIWQQDGGLTVQHKDGHLVIAGRTGDVREIPPTAGFRFTGLVSKVRFQPADAVLVAKMKVPGGIQSTSGMERYNVHFCAASPDYFTEVILGRDRDGRSGWSFLSGSQYGHNTDYIPTPIGEWDPKQFQTIKIDYDSASQVSRGWLWSSESRSWKPAGAQQDIFLSAVQVELKVNIPQNGLNVEARFDDCRLYRKPESAPVKILVYRYPVPTFSFPGVSVSLYEADGKTLIGKGLTDANGMCSIALSGSLTYPIAAVIKLQHAGEDLGSAKIQSSGVEGLYPGDLWVVNAPGRFKGTYAPRASKTP